MPDQSEVLKSIYNETKKLTMPKYLELILNIKNPRNTHLMFIAKLKLHVWIVCMRF